MIEAIIKYASRPDPQGNLTGQPYISMTYGQTPSGQGYKFIVNQNDFEALPDDRGIYFLLSHEQGRLQKIGLTNGLRGFQQRINGYRQVFDPNNPGNDPSPAFWYRIMTENQLRNNNGGERAIGNVQIKVYFRSYTQTQTTTDKLAIASNMTQLSYDPHADMERGFIAHAKTLRRPNPEGLFEPGEAFPLLLDSKHRIKANRFMQD